MNVWELLYLPGLDEGLARVEEELRRAVTSPEPLLTEVASHLVDAGGKRLRPALVLAAAASTGCGPVNEVVRGAVSVELVHMGSLYHDDVIDEASSRRGVESVNARWGNLVAILAGDFLLAKASEIAAGLGTEVVRVLANAIGQLCQGEMIQLHDSFSTGRTENAYLDAIALQDGFFALGIDQDRGHSRRRRPLRRRVPHQLRPRVRDGFPDLGRCS